MFFRPIFAHVGDPPFKQRKYRFLLKLDNLFFFYLTIPLPLILNLQPSSFLLAFYFIRHLPFPSSFEVCSHAISYSIHTQPEPHHTFYEVYLQYDPTSLRNADELALVWGRKPTFVSTSSAHLIVSAQGLRITLLKRSSVTVDAKKQPSTAKLY